MKYIKQTKAINGADDSFSHDEEVFVSFKEDGVYLRVRVTHISTPIP